MTRAQLEHLIRAAGAITDTQDLIVIGSQSVLGQFPDAPDELLISNEADMFPREDPQRSDLIDGTIGEDSPFELTFGYYAYGVDETTAVLPQGWRDRLIIVSGENTRFVRGSCLEVHDLAISKYAAGREKDLEFTQSLARHTMVNRYTLEQRLAMTLVDDRMRSSILARIRRDFGVPKPQAPHAS
ncbi:MAG TPA: DUF6036 family nucleotidyltransferase [Bryobacteraceae bacterium]|nr:DUF6036 family nucleotidyltransferase [Bryobacteraceae bacterium]